MDKHTSVVGGERATPPADRSAAPEAGRRPGIGTVLAGAGRAFLRFREAGVLLVALALMVYFQATSAAFLTTPNLLNLAELTAGVAIIAAGLVLLLISGEIDLSVGHVYAQAPFVMYFAADAGLPIPAAVLLALLAAAAVGLFNGLVTTKLGVPSFVTTLGTLFALHGITLITSNGFPVSPPTTGALRTVLGDGRWVELIWAVVIVIVFQLVLTRTRWGLHTVATGGNALGASEAGIRVHRIKIGNFVITSVLGAIAGILVAHRIGSIDPLSGGEPIMFRAVAAAVIGGTVLAGGSGTVVGGFLGALVMAILIGGFSLIGVDAFTFNLILGIAILLAMIGNVRLARLRRAGRV